MTYITKLTEIVDGRLLPSDKKLSSSLLEVDTGIPEVGAGRLTITGDTLGFDYTGLATESYVMGAIESAQVDLRGYATTTELNEAITEITTGMPLLVDTKVNAAIATVVDNAPATFDTLKEIATWIETEGVAATDLASAIAGKADRTELDEFRNEAEINTLIETYVMETYNPQLGSNITLLLDNKVDKIEGKRLSTEDFTTAYKTKLDDIDNQKLDIPTSVSSSTITTPTVNSLPLYTLGNNGDYVLCTPDAWLNINGLLVPGYNPTTIQG